MNSNADLVTRCLAVVDTLNQELGWQLSDDNRHAYAARLAALISESCSAALLRQIATNFHHDHQLVEALQCPNHRLHGEAWDVWMGKIVTILCRAGLAWSNDAAVDLEDLAQVARAELVRSIASFRYTSRFSTWAHQVVGRSVQRTIRDSQVQKRAGRPESLDPTVEYDLPIPDKEHPESIAMAQEFASQISEILARQPDQRLLRIFWLWAEADLPVEAIGRIVQLHPSRVRTLLAQLRHVLQAHPTIQAWYVEAQPANSAYAIGAPRSSKSIASS